MKAAGAIASILKRVGVDWMIGYSVNDAHERGAVAGTHPIIVWQDGAGPHVANVISSGA